jgi:hypothetical protein
MSPLLEKELHEQLDRLSAQEQYQVLEFACNLASTHARGVPGSRLLHFGGTISPADLQLMAQAIEAGCQKRHPAVD